MAKAKSTTTVEMTTYLLYMKDGTKRKFTCPSSWKVTFGPLVPGSNKEGNMNGGGATSLHFYADQAHQKAVFTQVESFRDTSMQYEEEVVQTQEEQFYKKDEHGHEKTFVMEGKIRQWVNPDAPKPARAGQPDLLLIPNSMKEVPK